MTSQTNILAAHVIAQRKPCIFQVIVSASEVLSFLPSRTVTQREFGKFLIVLRNFCPIKYLTGLSPLTDQFCYGHNFDFHRQEVAGEEFDRSL